MLHLGSYAWPIESLQYLLRVLSTPCDRPREYRVPSTKQAALQGEVQKELAQAFPFPRASHPYKKSWIIKWGLWWGIFYPRASNVALQACCKVGLPSATFPCPGILCKEVHPTALRFFHICGMLSTTTGQEWDSLGLKGLGNLVGVLYPPYIGTYAPPSPIPMNTPTLKNLRKVGTRGFLDQSFPLAVSTKVSTGFPFRTTLTTSLIEWSSHWVSPQAFANGRGKGCPPFSLLDLYSFA